MGMKCAALVGKIKIAQGRPKRAGDIASMQWFWGPWGQMNGAPGVAAQQCSAAWLMAQ